MAPVGTFNHPFWGTVSILRRDGVYDWIRLPVTDTTVKTALRALCMSDEERAVVDCLGRNIIMRIVRADRINMLAEIVRRENCFRAVLVHSRGRSAGSICTNKCARHNNGSLPFLACYILEGYFNNVCSSCLYASHTIRCSHYVNTPLSSGEEDGGDDNNNNVENESSEEEEESNEEEEVPVNSQEGHFIVISSDEED
ncbi:hypothetical protein NUW58_g10230 [Xylaria curta]|uniref:Uncharacterized protein n=1 Tax=Xylaria curta TaxID=42375 RepID=A0ACC1MN12_9PEZI|nr:hypothetical protein NUW58_g10230 [Xylaria curta]